MKAAKRRIDLVLVERGLAESRAKAQALLLAGRVYQGEKRIDKPGALVPEDVELMVREADRYVSRGGRKLEGALRDLALRVESLRVLDIGASTGGFTDCVLQHGAAAVTAVDVGQGQLAQKLANDPRVVVMDNINARHLSSDMLPWPPDLILIDASFIGLAKLLPAVAQIAPPKARLLALVKPQFEVGKEEARRARGVIRNPEAREQAISGVRDALKTFGFVLVGECPSAVPGPKGNVEHFVLAEREPAQSTSTQTS